MAYPDHRGQELEKSVAYLEEQVSKLEHQMEWIDLHILTPQERVEMEEYCDIE